MATGDDRKRDGSPGGRKPRAVKPQTIDLEATKTAAQPQRGPAKGTAAAAGGPKADPAAPAGDAATATGPEKTAGDAQPDAGAGAAGGDKTAQRTAETGPDRRASATPGARPSDSTEDNTAGQAGAGASAARGTGTSGGGASPPPGDSPPQGGGRTPFAALVAAGVAGGVIVLLAQFALTMAGLLPDRGAEMAALRDEVAGYATEPDLSDIEGRLETLEAGDGASAALDDIETRLAALEQAPAPGTGDDVAALETRLADLESTLDALPEPADQGDVEARIDDLEQALETLRADVGEEIATLARESAGPADADLARAAAASIAASGLARSLDSGIAYRNELAALAPLIAEDHDALDTLADHADSGIPTAQQLAARFPAVADAILDADAPDRTGRDIFDRLAAGARSLVRVRPVGDIDGDSREAIVARIETALERGDPARAHDEWQGLDDAARDAGGEWGAQLAARVEAEQSLSQLIAAIGAGVGARTAPAGDSGAE